MRHEPVLLSEVLSLLSLKPGSVVLDGTLGSGGHAEAILNAIGPSGILIGIDQDEQAIERTKKRLAPFQKQVIFSHSNFKDIDEVLSLLKVSHVDAVLLDIGVSLEQLSEGGRGFSFRIPGPLDMRMNQKEGLTASDLIRELSEKELSDIFFTYGEERRARQIARWIVDERRKEPITTTARLAEIIEKRTPVKVRYGRIHPATRVFQALRIAVNGELDVLHEVLPKALSVLSPDGRIAVITFHSLEDRIVKQTFLRWKAEGKVKILTKKPMIPNQEEINYNSKSRSAKLRVAEKL